MKRRTAALAGGLLAGVVTSAAMVIGRRTGLTAKTLDRDSADWIDRETGARAVVGDTGVTAAEFVNHLGASTAFGLGYAELRERVAGLPPAALGALFGAGLYALNIAGVAPLVGITEGEVRAGPRKAAERLATHLLYGVVLAIAAERLTDKGDAE